MKWLDHHFDNVTVQLPEQHILPPPIHESDYYGARKSLCKYAERNDKHYRLDWVWQHGWIRDQLLVDPAIVLTSRLAHNKKESFLVATQKQQEFLENEGYTNVKAVGLPIVYSELPHPPMRRIPNSLLVMPMHSLESTKRKSNFDDYAALINDLKNEFDFVLVCLHYACIRNNFWINEFEKYGIPWIEGGNVFDQNCLPRLGALFSQFEYVTTNGYGSHLPYSAYFGAKTSIYGDFPPRHARDYVNDPFFKKFPHLLKTYFPLLQEEVIKDDIPFLFCPPKAAKKHTEWAQKELGQPNKLNLSQARKLLKDDRLNQLRRSTKRITRRIYQSSVPEGIKHYDQFIRNSDYRVNYRRQKKVDRLAKLPHFQEGTIDIFGTQLHYLNSYSFHHTFNEVFNEKVYEFASDTPQPYIVDIGANVGLSILYFKQLYPEAKIVGFEFDNRIFKLLKQNIAASGWQGIRLVNKETIGCSKEKVLEAVYAKSAPLTDSISVQKEKPALCSFLDQKVDLLKVSIDEPVLPILKECQQYLANVKRIFLAYHSSTKEDQQLEQLLATLKEAGFKYYIDTPKKPHIPPFMRVEQSMKTDIQLKIYGIRE